MFVDIQDFYVCVYVCVIVHAHTLLIFSVCEVHKKIDLGSVTTGPAGMRGANGCLSQRKIHTRTNTHTRSSETLLPPGHVERNTDLGSSRR